MKSFSSPPTSSRPIFKARRRPRSITLRRPRRRAALLSPLATLAALGIVACFTGSFAFISKVNVNANTEVTMVGHVNKRNAIPRFWGIPAQAGGLRRAGEDFDVYRVIHSNREGGASRQSPASYSPGLCAGAFSFQHEI